MAAEGRFYRLSILVDLQDRMQSAMEKVTGTAERFEQRLKNTARAAQMLDRQKIAPVLEGRDRLTTRLKTVASSLRSLTTTAWTVTLRAKDEVSRITNKIGSALSSPLGMLGMGAATVGAGGLMLNSADKAMDFEAQLSSIKALTGATSEEMERMRALSLKLGADTKYSALEAAQGFEELLKAGLSVGQVENGGAEAALNLATAGALDLAEAAEIMSTAMNAYKSDNLSAAQAANILAGTANASATGVKELQYSLAAVSAVASGVGMSFQDTNVALGLFANNGLKGSDAGTSLKTMLMNLIPDTKKAIEEFERLGLMTEQGTSAFFDQQGHLKSLTAIADLLQKSMAGMTDEQRLLSMQTMFGSDAIRAANILYKEGADGVKNFTAEMLKVTALDVAKEKMNNAKGAIEELSGAFETVQIRAMTPFLPLVTRIAQGLGSTIDGAADAIVARAETLAADINGFLDELASDEKFQAMDWGDKVVYVLDRMISAVDEWSSGPGGEQLGKVFTKLAEIGMRAWMTALGGMMKGSLNSLLSGNLTGAAGLALGANFLGAGTLLKGGYSLAKGMLGRGAAASEAAGAAPGGGFWSKAKDIWSTGRQLTGIDQAYASYRTSGIFGGAAEAARPGLLSRGWNLAGSVLRLAQTPLGGLLSKAAVPLGMAIDALGVAQADNKIQAAGGMAGRWTGAWAGSKAGVAGGAAIGSLIAPGVGTAVGGVLGGIGGGIGGFFAGGKLGEYLGGLASQLDFTPVKARIVAAKDEMSAAVSAWFDTLPERVGYAVGYSYTYLSELPGRGAAYFSQLVNEADAYISALPGRLGVWWAQTYGDATAWASQTVNDTTAWFSSLPGRAETAWQGLYQTVDAWASNTYTSVINWFSNIPSAIGGYFDQAINNISSKASGLWNRVTSGFSAGQAAAGLPGHATGGIFNTPHVALFAEEGAEAVIPLNPSRRARALEIWEETGNALGVRKYADGGLSGSVSANPLSGLVPVATPKSSGGLYATVENLTIVNDVDEDALALQIGRKILEAAKQASENSVLEGAPG